MADLLFRLLRLSKYLNDLIIAQPSEGLFVLGVPRFVDDANEDIGGPGGSVAVPCVAVAGSLSSKEPH